MDATYESKISTPVWLILDLIGNSGLILYFIGLILSFVKKPEFMKNNSMLIFMILSIIPAILFLIGSYELIVERIKKLDRILPKKRLYRGFGSIYVGGLLGLITSVIGIIYGYYINGTNLLYVWLMVIGSLMIIVGVIPIFTRYKKVEE
ncbi:hypothetical protein PIROE2DRAFT_5693 [Piromyces sp. E2]|nr:hypothetical protein PIROE2DRAFT_5693 [Piromyces sp. E2]|eukprot:OUM66957.1 hypothetical protein PIROE2DRAFT_5693 [Piromyces sp. E2]